MSLTSEQVLYHLEHCEHCRKEIKKDIKKSVYEIIKGHCITITNENDLELLWDEPKETVKEGD